MKKLLASILLLAVLLTMLCGCSAKQPAAVTSAPDTEETMTQSTTFGLKPFEDEQTLSIGFFAGSQVAIPFTVAINEGFFEELNIKVELSTFTNGPAMMEANSDWDIAAAGVAGALTGQVGYDLHVVGIADRETNQVLFVREDSPIAKNPDDPEAWKGTKWLYPLGATAHLVLSKKIESLGLTMGDIESVNMDVSNAYTVFTGGEGDGVVLWSNFTFKAEDEGYIRVADASTVGAPSSACVLMTPDAIENKSELMATAWSLYYLTADWCNANETNTETAMNYYYQSCLDEGISATEDTARRTYKLALDYPKGYFVSVGERDIEVFLTEYCGAAALEEYLREKRLSAAREIERWREERLWDTNPVSSAGAAALNFTFDAASGTLGTDGGVNELRELETPSSVDGVRVRAIGRYGLAAYRRLQRLVLTDSLEEIPEYLIYGFMELRYVKISSHITVIPVGAFGRCKALKTVEIPEGVTEICRDAFFNDSSIERLTVPDSVTRVGGCAFVGVRRLSYGGSAPGYPWGASRVLGKLNY